MPLEDTKAAANKKTVAAGSKKSTAAQTTKKPAAPAKKPAPAKPAQAETVTPETATTAPGNPDPAVENAGAAALDKPAAAPEVHSEETGEVAAAPIEIKDALMIHSKHCMDCQHLCPEVGSVPYTNCHYDNGNDACPAKTTVIIIGMPATEVDKAARAIVEATAQGDFERLNRIAKRLASKSEAIREQVSRRVLELQQNPAA